MVKNQQSLLITFSLYLKLNTLVTPSLLTFFLAQFFSKVATAGQRTAEAALGSICVTTHRPQQTTDIQNTVAERERQSEREERDRRVADAQNCLPRIDRG